MQGRRVWQGLLAVAVGLSAAGALAAAGPSERVAVGGLGNEGDPFSPALYVTLARPAEYRLKERDRFSGRWIGPSYAHPGAGSGSPATIAWDATLLDAKNPPGAHSAGEALQKAFFHDWAKLRRKNVSVPHVVAGKRVGTIAAVLELRQAEGSAELEGVIVFSICRGAYAAARVDTQEPRATDNVVKGSIPALQWNEQQALAALERAGLPPQRIVVHGTKSTVTGTVLDCHAHPVAGAGLVLQAKSGGWRAVGHGTTGPTGAFKLKAGGAGVYRVVASTRAFKAYATPSAASPPVRAG
jgi:hypothetical protein